MSPSQFQTLMDRLDLFEQRFSGRLTRVEAGIATITGGLILLAFMLANGYVDL